MPPIIPLRQIDEIVIHCSATPDGRLETVEEIDSWHQQNGWHRLPHWRIAKRWNQGLTSIGYHFVIYTDGTRHTGRHIDEIGAHVQGHNSRSLGICMVGDDEYSPAQWAELKALITELQSDIKASSHRLAAKVKGHYQYDTAVKQGKTCPNFDVPAWLDAGMVPDKKHIYTGPRPLQTKEISP